MDIANRRSSDRYDGCLERRSDWATAREREDAVPGAIMSHSGVMQVRTHMHALSLHNSCVMQIGRYRCRILWSGRYIAQPPGTERSLSDLVPDRRDDTRGIPF